MTHLAFVSGQMRAAETARSMVTKEVAAGESAADMETSHAVESQAAVGVL